eukprot:GHVH01004187.1.p1 GENE.GHVH01004187.1~~GHVH01004187.1.p1  ORF type:complete len:298 (+),score=60.23 GHVH01004187.1:1121-2014(+)
MLPYQSSLWEEFAEAKKLLNEERIKINGWRRDGIPVKECGGWTYPEADDVIHGHREDIMASVSPRKNKIAVVVQEESEADNDNDRLRDQLGAISTNVTPFQDVIISMIVREVEPRLDKHRIINIREEIKSLQNEFDRSCCGPKPDQLCLNQTVSLLEGVVGDLDKINDNELNSFVNVFNDLDNCTNSRMTEVVVNECDVILNNLDKQRDTRKQLFSESGMQDVKKSQICLGKLSNLDFTIVSKVINHPQLNEKSKTTGLPDEVELVKKGVWDLSAKISDMCDIVKSFSKLDSSMNCL